MADAATARMAANLRELRHEAGLSQEALAHLADLHPNAVGLLERGLRDPRLSTLRALASALNGATSARRCISIEDLVRGVC